MVVRHTFARQSCTGIGDFLSPDNEEKAKAGTKHEASKGLGHELVTVKKRLSRMLSPAEKARRPSVQKSELEQLF